MQNQMDQLLRPLPHSWQALAEEVLIRNVLAFQAWQNFWVLPFFEASLMPLALLSREGDRSEQGWEEAHLRLPPS